MRLHTLVYNATGNFKENVAVVYDDGTNALQSITYSKLWENVEEISDYFSSLHLTYETVAVVLNQNMDLPAILLGLLLNGCCFFPVSIENGQKYITNSIRKVGAAWIIHDCGFEKTLSSTAEQLCGEYINGVCMDKFHVKIMRLKLGSSEDVAIGSTNIGEMAYCITTSGTTGSPKVIRVPHSCIIPNVIDLRKIFHMNEKDKMLLTAPLTFDPSIIDIFLTLSTGSTLLIVPDTVKKNPDLLIKVLHSRQNVTVLQATPSLILRCPPSQLRQTILGPNSSLRVLALGGEEFPSSLKLKKMVDPLNETRFYNLYGITEVSCWASCQRVDIQNIIKNNDIVSVGKPLSKTLIRVKVNVNKELDVTHQEQGYINIGSSERVCVVDSDDSSSVQLGDDKDTNIKVGVSPVSAKQTAGEEGKVIWRNTGDIGKILEDGRIVFVGRMDDQIKRHGKRMKLSALEAICCELPWISKCCALMNERNQLVVFYNTENNGAKPIDLSHSEIDPLPTDSISEDRVKSSGQNYISTDHKTETAFLKLGGGLSTSYDTQETSWKMESGGHETEGRILRTHIEHSLPSHYMPDRFVSVETFPLTVHGKLDRKKLLEMKRSVKLNIELLDESPVVWMKQLWMTYLPESVTNINVNDTFLSLGGDSLAAVNLVNQLEDVCGTGAQTFLDSLLNKTFSGCVDDFQEYYLKLDIEGKELPAVCDVLNIEPETNSKESGEYRKNYEEIKRKDEESEREIIKKDKEACVPSQSDINPNKSDALKDWQNSHVECKTEFCKLGVLGRGNRMVNIQPDSLEWLKKSELKQDWLNDDSELKKKKYKINNQQNSSLTGVACEKSGKVKCQLDSDGSNQELSNEVCLRIRWTVNTKKCVDASPTIAVFSPTKRLVFIGSHSGHMTAVDLDSGLTVWTTVLPDRIESSACVTKNMKHVVAGCYNGVIYMLEVHSGVIEWEFPTGSCVKCSPCLDEGTGHVICGSHDGWLYSFDVEEKSCVWKYFFGGGSVYSSPVADLQSGLVFAASLNGKLAALNSVNGSLVWYADLNKPLFSSPCLHGDSILIGCVDCHLYCINKDGQTKWTFRTEGPVFSSPVAKNSFIFFGSHDCHLYCLTSSGQLVWKFNTPSPIFSTPFLFQLNISYNNLNCPPVAITEPKYKISRIEDRDFNSSSSGHNLLSTKTEVLDNAVYKDKTFLTFANTKGTLHIVDSANGKMVTSTQISGEVFSSLVVHDGKIVVGCRDNLLYCFDFFS